MWATILEFLSVKLFGALLEAGKAWLAKRARVKEIDQRVKDLKNATTPEQQEAAAAELLRVTTPSK